VVELGPGTDPVTEALVAEGIAPERLVLVEFNPTFCRLLRDRFPAATIVQATPIVCAACSAPVAATSRRDRVGTAAVRQAGAAAAASVSRGARAAGAERPFIQFTYAVVPPIPGSSPAYAPSLGADLENMPPARVWVYRKG